MGLPQSIRGRVVMLVVAVSLPLIGVLLWGFVEEVNRQHEEARDLALRIARSVATDIHESNVRSRALLLRMALRPKIQRADPADCDSLFAIVDFFPQYPNLQLYDLGGTRRCSATPEPRDAAYSAATEQEIAPYIHSHAMSESEPLVVLARDRWIAVTFQRVLANGVPVGVLALMQYIDLSTAAYPAGTVITISNLHRRIIARSREGRKWIGKLGTPTAANQILKSAEEGRLEGIGVDGVSRQYGFTRVRGIPWRVFVGLPSSAAMARFRGFLIRGIAVGLVIVGFITLLAIGITRTIERPLAVLARTVQLAAQPGFDEQVPIDGPREIRVVARAFNAMVSSRFRAEQALVESTTHLEALSKKLLEVQEEERGRIAREIHDELGQLLTALNMDIGGLLASAELTPDQRVMGRRIRQALSETLSSVQRISAELRPAILDDFGLIAAIELELEKFEHRTGIECDLSVPLDLAALPHDLEATLYRIVQEAMTNVARHSDATRVEVRLRRRDAEILLEVRDNGRGIPEQALHDRASIGLIGMRERARAIGGTLEVEGIAEQGTIVSLRVPIAHAVEEAHA